MHNICKSRQIPCPADDSGNDDENVNNQQDDGHATGNHQNGQTEGLRYRQLFAENHSWLVSIMEAGTFKIEIKNYISHILKTEFMHY